MLLLLQIHIRSDPSRFTLKNADHGQMHLVAATPVSTEALPVRVGVVAALVSKVVRAARAAIFLRKPVVAPSSNVGERPAMLRPKDVVKLKLSKQWAAAAFLLSN
jgi:hypothetical protein